LVRTFFPLDSLVPYMKIEIILSVIECL